MGLALYRKYRSRSLNEVVGQDHITHALSSALAAGQISHAYLFTGPKGVGKTSIARILAHEINQLPYEDESSHLDIIEIDAASSRRIDEIRDLRDKVNLAPSSAKYKVYIIDEVHMLTREAFNALLKTLEEPPSHVVFILATTELHKLPATIISRTQRFGFRPITNKDIVEHLQSIASKEGIIIDDAALALIADHSDGGFRDAISMLDQVRHLSKHITKQDVELLIGLPAEDLLNSLLQATIDGQGHELMNQLGELFDQGYHPTIILQSLLRLARNMLLESADDGPKAQLLKLMKALNDAGLYTNNRVAIELALLETAGSVESRSDSIEKPKQQPKAATIKAVEPAGSIPIKLEEPKPQNTKNLPQVKTDPKPVTASKSIQPTPELWSKVLETLKGQHNTLYGILRMAQTDFADDKAELTLSFQFPFHMKRAAEGKHATIIHETVKNISGQDFAINFKKLTINPVAKQEPEAKKKATKSMSPADPLATVREVFGGGEVIS